MFGHVVGVCAGKLRGFTITILLCCMTGLGRPRQAEFDANSSNVWQEQSKREKALEEEMKQIEAKEVGWLKADSKPAWPVLRFVSAILYRHGFWPKVMKKEERKRKALLEAEKRKALLHKHFLASLAHGSEKVRWCNADWWWLMQFVGLRCICLVSVCLVTCEGSRGLRKAKARGNGNGVAHLWALHIMCFCECPCWIDRKTSRIQGKILINRTLTATWRQSSRSSKKKKSGDKSFGPRDGNRMVGRCSNVGTRAAQAHG